MHNLMNIYEILLLSDHKRTFWEELKYEVEDLFNVIIEFFMDIYDTICGVLGGDLANLFLIALGALIVMLVAMSIINGNGNKN